MSTPRILLAEDEPQIARLIEYILRKEGYDIIWAENGIKAWQTVQTEDLDLILLDLMLPLMSGFEILEKVKSDTNYKNIPVVILTAKSHDRDVQKGMDMGADKYIKKPFNPVDLIDQIHSVLNI